MFEKPMEGQLADLQENLQEIDESAALELSVDAAELGLEEAGEGVESDMDIAAAPDRLDEMTDMEGVMDALRLTDAEKAAFREIGKDIQDMPVANGVKGYKKGSCHDRLIPIYS